MTVRVGSFGLTPPRKNPKHTRAPLPDLERNAIDVLDHHPPDGAEPVEWMRLTNRPVGSCDEADEQGRGYGLRWGIALDGNVLKSGVRVEACRRGHAERLARSLTVMSIVAWRVFMITLIARTDPAVACSTRLADHEWNVLSLKANKNKTVPKTPPCIGDVIMWIAKLGGYRARRSDGPPGTITLWRGWKRLANLTEGWNLATHA